MSTVKPEWPRRLAGSLFALFLLALPFQNCGRYDAMGSGDSASAQCRAQFKADAVKALAADQAQGLDCLSLASYRCEARVFNPDRPAGEGSRTECLGSSGCVVITERVFNTAAALAFEPAESFAPGREYNREEFRCRHFFTQKGIALFDGAGDSLGEALQGAIGLCTRATETEGS